MYCPSCNSYNDDANRFCASCGAPLQKQQAEQPDAGSWEAPQQNSYSYQQPYQPPYSSSLAEPTKPITMATPVVALILNVVFFNLIGLVLGILSLVNFNNYTSEKNRGSIELAETYKHKSKTFATIADVLGILTLVFVVAMIVAAVVFGVLSLSGGGAPEIHFDGNNIPQDFFGMIG